MKWTCLTSPSQQVPQPHFTRVLIQYKYKVEATDINQITTKMNRASAHQMNDYTNDLTVEAAPARVKTHPVHVLR